MSKTFSYKINPESILTRVKMDTHYVAQKMAEDGSTFERVAIINANKEILDTSILKGIDSIVLLFQRWITSLPQTKLPLEDEIEFNLSVADASDPVQLDNLTDLTEKYLVAFTLGEWMAKIDTEKSSDYMKEAEGFSSMMSESINSRIRLPRIRIAEE